MSLRNADHDKMMKDKLDLIEPKVVRLEESANEFEDLRDIQTTHTDWGRVWQAQNTLQNRLQIGDAGTDSSEGSLSADIDTLLQLIEADVWIQDDVARKYVLSIGMRAMDSLRVVSGFAEEQFSRLRSSRANLMKDVLRKWGEVPRRNNVPPSDRSMAEDDWLRNFMDLCLRIIQATGLLYGGMRLIGKAFNDKELRRLRNEGMIADIVL